MHFCDRRRVLQNHGIYAKSGFTQPKDYKPELESAVVYVSADRGNTWHEIPMGLKERWEREGSFLESWVAESPLNKISPDGVIPIVYFFQATSNSGSVAMELPTTSPGWPPNTTQFFPAVKQMTHVIDSDFCKKCFNIFESLRLTDSYVAFDGTNLFLAFQTNSGVLPFSINDTSANSSVADFRSGNNTGITPNIYAMKFANTSNDLLDGFPVGKWQFYAPLFGCTVIPFDLYEINNFYLRLLHVCRSAITPIVNGDFNIGISDKGFFSRFPLSRICPDGCERVRIVIGAMDYYSLYHFEDHVFLPTFEVYFRMHSIGEEIHEAFGGTAQGLAPPTQFAPEQGRTWSNSWLLWPENDKNVEAMKSAYEKFLSTPEATF